MAFSPVLASMGFPVFMGIFLAGLLLFAVFAAKGQRFFDKSPDSKQQQDRVGVGGEQRK
jgi:membrane protein implicated in regulation of membrane protease activity